MNPEPINIYENYYRWFRNHWISVLLWAYSAFVLYITMAPFSPVLDPEKMVKNLFRVEIIPFFLKGRNYSGADIFLNIFIFFNLGALLASRKMLKHYRHFSRSDWRQMMAYGFLLSFAIEVLQIFTYNRQSDISDLLTNVIGTALGILAVDRLYLRFSGIIKKILKFLFWRKPEMVAAMLLVILIAIVQFGPFEFVLDTHTMAKRLAEFQLNPFRMGDGFWTAAGLSIFLYSALTHYLLHGVAFYFPRMRRLSGWFAIILLLLLAALAMEVLQFSLPHKRHSIADVLGSWLGILLGGTWAIWRLRKLFDRGSTTTISRAVPERRKRLANTALMLQIWGAGYLGFYFLRLAEPLLAGVYPELISGKIYYFFHPLLWLYLNAGRVYVLIQLFETGLIYFFFSFFMTNFLSGMRIEVAEDGNSGRSRWRSREIVRLCGIFLIIDVVVTISFGAGLMHVSQLFVAGFLIWTGMIVYKFYEFLFTEE